MTEVKLKLQTKVYGQTVSLESIFNSLESISPIVDQFFKLVSFVQELNSGEDLT